jgi:hypothetical protein
MWVEFTLDYQGYLTGPHFYPRGTIAELDDAVAMQLIADKHAVAYGDPEPIEQPQEIDLSALSVAELREAAKARAVPYAGLRKADLIKALQ